MSKSMIAALGFSVCALAFLLYSWVAYGGASADAEDAKLYWESAESLRRQFVTLKGQLARIDTARKPTGSIDFYGLMSKLRDECGITTKMDVTAASGAIGGQRDHTVRFSDVTVKTMGDLLAKLKARHGYLVVSDISMTASRSAVDPGHFNWKLTIGVPES